MAKCIKFIQTGYSLMDGIVRRQIALSEDGTVWERESEEMDGGNKKPWDKWRKPYTRSSSCMIRDLPREPIPNIRLPNIKEVKEAKEISKHIGKARGAVKTTKTRRL